MGMLDTYEPNPRPVCRWCGDPIRTFQGKDGPNVLLIWRQHHRFPAHSPTVAEESRLDEAALRRFTLPERFAFTGFCARHEPSWFTGRCVDGIWVDTIPMEDPTARR
jgi:hypothetical protein